MKILIKRW